MRIVHTADVHLSPDHPERFEALEQVVEKCGDEDADLLLITGDLFDKNVDIEGLKTDLRPLFSDNSFQTLVIPGNHDNSAFRREDYFGDDLEVLTDRPYSSKVFGDVNIVALPYTEKSFSELVEPLSEAVEEGKTNILMIHCTLAGNSGGFGDEERYLPVKPQELVRTGFDYVLAGHIHSSATRRKFGATTFAYSGSPVSISSSETGKRKIWLLDTDEGMETRELDTFYCINESGSILPGEEEELKDKITGDLEQKDLGKASVILELDGFTERPVDQFSRELKDDVKSLGPESIDVNVSGLESASSLVDSEIYREFRERLEEKDFENPELVEKKFLRGLSRHER
ncbi:metallophosphoesterase family protein [Candidatus Nanosalina sp. VS9-1]|uniref:metallophosphoesterase family protein n=1 Tax=Candidatus Nanosalina sp. VS9-1 TaxID=3388566 RepID=UPI0039DF684B